MFRYFNPNPDRSLVGDCVVRAICKLQNRRWEDVYVDICLEGLILHNMPSSNDVWGSYLMNCGYSRYSLPDTCPACYTVRDFCIDHPIGAFLLATGTHVIAVIDGDYYDTWDSGDESPAYYWM